MSDDALQVFEDTDRQGSVHGREVVEELRERRIVFEVVEQGPHRHASADEYRCSAQQLRIGMYPGDRLGHGAIAWAR